MIIGEWNTDEDPLLTPAEVAGLFRVDPKTVNRWARHPERKHLLPSIRTLGGHRRYRSSYVYALLRGENTVQLRMITDGELKP